MIGPSAEQVPGDSESSGGSSTRLSQVPSLAAQQKKGNKKGRPGREGAREREKRKRGRRELTQSLARSQHRGLRASNVRGGIYLNTEKRGQLHSARLILLFYSENKRDFELLRDSGIRGLSFQPQSALPFNFHFIRILFEVF